jgi:phosphatidylinositol glycan class M
MSLKRALVLFVMFFAGELHWLFWGYQLEFLGLPVFAGVWAAGLLFFAANIFALHECVRYHQLGSFAALK